MPSQRRALPILLASAAVVIGTLVVIRPERPPSGTTASKSTFQAVCATCHGPRGEGRQDRMAPPIANLTAWYVDAQLAKFRSGLRGADPRDIHGQQMRAAVLALSDEALAEATAELATLAFTPPAPPAPLPGDAHAGAELYRELCMECHRYNGHGEFTFQSAPIAGLPTWYIDAQISKFQAGIRGYDPHDESGTKMREMSQRAANDAERADILSFLTTLAGDYPIAKQAPDRSHD